MRNEEEVRDVVVVGASAGGIEAMTGFFGGLPSDLAAAILVVLHIPSDTPSHLAPVLERTTRLPVSVAEDGEKVRPGRIYVASADRHLMVEANSIRVTRGPREGRMRPSIDVLFRSAAAAFGARTIGVVLSGALDDGTAGAWAIKDRKGLVFVQEPSEAMHASMPESTIRHVEVDLVAGVETLAQTVSGIVGAPAPVSRGPQAASERLRVENLIAMEGNGLKAGVMNLGPVSRYTCPDCNGVLVQIEEGTIVRFRCHTGHAFSLMTLLAEVNESIDKGLWDTLRAVEERVMLLRQMADLARKAGNSGEADRCTREADDAQKRLEPVRAIVLDPHFFGHDQR